MGTLSLVVLYVFICNKHVMYSAITCPSKLAIFTLLFVGLSLRLCAAKRLHEMLLLQRSSCTLMVYRLIFPASCLANFKRSVCIRACVLLFTFMILFVMLSFFALRMMYWFPRWLCCT